MNLKEMQEKREKLVHDAREALDQIKSNTDESRAAELEARHDTIMSEFDKLGSAIEREERVAAAEKSMEVRREAELRGRRPVEAVNNAPASDSGSEISYRDAFHAYLRAEGQLGEMEPEARAVLKAGYQELRAQTTSSNGAGGYTVPTELQNELIRSMKAFGPMYDPGVTRELMTPGGYSLPFPTIDNTGGSSTVAGTTQGTTLTDDGSGDKTFAQKSLSAYAYATPWVRVSKELADDSVLAMEALMADLLGEDLGRKANNLLTVGTGSSQPQGIVVGSTTGKTAASTTVFTADEIIDLIHSVDPAYRAGQRVSLMMHDTVLAAVRKLKDGNGRYIWADGNFQSGIPQTVLGYNIVVNQDMASAFTTGQKLILFGDLGKYFVRKVGAPLVGALQDKDFWPGFGVAGWIRFDGALMDTAAVKHLKLA
jgi:HK97 family phage major capsid protein